MGCGGGVLTTGPDCGVSYAFLKWHKFFVFWFIMLAKDHVNYACVGVLS